MAIQGRYTNRQDWELYWERIGLQDEIKKERKNILLNEILNIFDRYFPRQKNYSILEIGGAPGLYLIYMAKNFLYDIYALDYSESGCRRMRENFKKHDLAGIIYQQDLFSDLTKLPKFDIVYSLGFVEHFSDLEKVIERHLELLKGGGFLLIGIPNLLGVNHMVLRRLDPDRLSRHNLSVMNIKKWERFEKNFNLRCVYKGYIGGFEPGIYRCAKKNLLNSLIYYCFMGIKKLLTDRFQFLRRFNSKYWSAYAVGVYQKDIFFK